MSQDLSPNPIRVVHLIDSLGVGGAQQILFDLVKGWPRKGWDVRVVGLHGFEPYGSRIAELGVPVKVLAPHRRSLPRILAGVRSLFQKEKPHLLHVYLSVSSFLATALRPRNTSTRILLHDQSGEEFVQDSFPVYWKPMVRPLERRFWRRASRVICVSRAIEEFNRTERRLPSENLILQGNAFDAARFPGSRAEGRRRLAEFDLPSNVQVVGAVGRLVVYKGFDVLIRAFASIAEDFPEAALVLVGDGPERVRLEALAESLGIQKRVAFTGYQSAIPDLMAAMDLFVFPSRIEPFGIVGLEALGSGLPVIATRVGGIPDFIGHETEGLLVAPEDAASMGAAMRRCLGNPEWARSLASRGQARVRSEYSIEVFLQRMESIYKDVLAAR